MELWFSGEVRPFGISCCPPLHPQILAAIMWESADGFGASWSLLITPPSCSLTLAFCFSLYLICYHIGVTRLLIILSYSVLSFPFLSLGVVSSTLVINCISYGVIVIFVLLWPR